MAQITQCSQGLSPPSLDRRYPRDEKPWVDQRARLSDSARRDVSALGRYVLDVE